MTCGHSHLLDAVVAGEANAQTVLEVRAHAHGCARCRHELNWLETERSLFRQRAGRDEVAHLWAGVKPVGHAPPRRLALLALLAAGVVAVLGLSRITGPHFTSGASELSATLQSEPLESLPDEPAACSVLPRGLGFQCGPAVQASFVASRE